MSPMRATLTVADWKAMVYRHRGEGVGNGVRVLLLYLADHMQANLQVSVSRQKIATDLGVSTSEIRNRFHAAKAAGLLDHVQVGRPGTQAKYVGIFPDLVTPGYPSDGNHGVPKKHNKHGTGNPPMYPADYGNPGVPAISKHSQTSAFTLDSPRGRGEQQQQRSDQGQDDDGRSHHHHAPERSDATERSEGDPAPLGQAVHDWRATVHDGWCLAGCGIYLNTPEGQASGYCAQHRKDTAA
ncbi:hypothetical protein [Mariniluteicoccus flavus]